MINYFLSQGYASKYNPSSKRSSSKNLPSEQTRDKALKSEQNVTKMVLVMCAMFLVGNVPNSISPILFTFNVNSVIYSIYVIFGNFMLFISRGSFFFIYYFFNSKFRHVLNNLVSKLFSSKISPINPSVRADTHFNLNNSIDDQFLN